MSLPYHHPLVVVDRWILLDHITRGRVIFGTGPGALPTDAYMMGIDPVDQRRMQEESLEAILALLRAAPQERISRETSWFTLRLAGPRHRAPGRDTRSGHRGLHLRTTRLRSLLRRGWGIATGQQYGRC
ncbi:monooxygenase [Mycobacteroides abscessus subsp. abscessus]|nr:monooxygenase [Mycobacteroides abscessus subsp. abscessus]